MTVPLGVLALAAVVLAVWAAFRWSRQGAADATRRPALFVSLRDTSDAGGTRRLWATRDRQGKVVITGHDLGQGVEGALGPGIREYEWVWTIQATDVPTLARVLGSEDVLRALAARFSGNEAAGLVNSLYAAGVPVAYWSRTGE